MAQSCKKIKNLLKMFCEFRPRVILTLTFYIHFVFILLMTAHDISEYNRSHNSKFKGKPLFEVIAKLINWFSIDQCSSTGGLDPLLGRRHFLLGSQNLSFTTINVINWSPICVMFCFVSWQPPNVGNQWWRCHHINFMYKNAYSWNWIRNSFQWHVLPSIWLKLQCSRDSWCCTQEDFPCIDTQKKRCTSFFVNEQT